MVHRRIEFWYGTRRRVGYCGIPQRWCNVVGRVTDVDELVELSAQLDGGERMPLSVGPDGRRLVAVGDFNVEVDLDAVEPGSHSIVVSARYRDGAVVDEEVVLDRGTCAVPSLPVHVSWEDENSLGDRAQVVDGRWERNGRFVTTREVGYDRLIAIGDVRWRDYDVAVPVVVHGLEARAFEWPSVHTGVGLVLRWKGHSRWSPDDRATGQPRFAPVPSRSRRGDWSSTSPTSFAHRSPRWTTAVRDID